MTALELLFPADLPAAKGHFPGNPIVPGALLLAEVLQAIGAQSGARLTPGHVKAAKFFAPVRPGERVRIEFGAAGAGEVKFSCTVAGAIVMNGQVRWLPIPATPAP
jgi:3-hydroxymyristoyl/3-hydroxydecanoyl-(acyl carrier protein) dehydratase